MMDADGTITATVVDVARPIGGASLLTLHLPGSQFQGGLAGRYFLARCGAQTALECEQNWQIYFRRPLFIVGNRPAHRQESGGEEVECLLPQGDDPGFAWLRELDVDASVNLLGPLGQGFTLHDQARNLLLLAEQARAAALFPLIEEMLNRQGRVTLIVRTKESQRDQAQLIIDRLPISVEVHVAGSDDEWQKYLGQTLTWADQLCAAIPASAYTRLVDAIRQQRFHLQEGFAQLLVEADLACGVGACLACVVPTDRGGLTRACVHGPVFDLVKLAR